MRPRGSGRWIPWLLLLGFPLAAGAAEVNAGGSNGENAGCIRPSIRVPALRENGPPGGALARQRLDDQICDSWIDTGHFRVHYATSGVHLIQGWPDSTYRDSLAGYLERSFRCYRDTLLLPVPPGDGTTGGGSDRIDCYVRSLNSSELGYALRDSCGSGGRCLYTCVGYMEVVNTLDDVSILRDIAAHELFHVFQLGLSADQESWLLESTAVWAEHRVWPLDSAHPAELAEWFATPYDPLWDDTGNREYGSAHYWLCLEAAEHASVVPDLWERCCTLDWRSALQQILQERGEGYDQSLYRFALWNYYTGTRDDGNHYRDGARYPEISFQARYHSYPVLQDSLGRDLLARAEGSNYIRFDGPGASDTLHVLFDGHYSLSGVRRVSFVATVAPNSSREWTFTPDENGDVSFDLPGWSATDYLTMIVSNGAEAAGHLGYRYSAWEGKAPVTRVLPLRCAPSPFSSSTVIQGFAPGGVETATVSILSADGREVRRFSLGPIRADDLAVTWDGRDARGNRVAPGVYFVRAAFGRLAGAGRVVVVH